MMTKPDGNTPLILCVEDEEALRRDLAEELIEAGYRVIEAENGARALEHIDRLRPDLILCDISMPIMGGYDLLSAVKARTQDLADIPFVFLTALADRQQVVEGKRSGADDYLVKPVDFDLMLATVEARLRQVSRIRAQGEGQFSAESAGLRTGLDDSTGPFLDVLSTGVILLNAEGGVTAANRAAKSIAQSCPDLSLGAVLTGDGAAGRKFRNWLTDLLSRTGEGDVAPLSLPRSDGGRDLMLVGCRLSCDTGGPAFAVFLTDPERPPSLSPDTLAKLFGLTPAETQIAMALAAGAATSEIAVNMGVSQTTVAFHLRNIFQKTGAKRQANLVAQLLTGPAAMLSPRAE